MMRSTTPTLGTATHVAFDLATAQRLSKLGATNVVRASDRLIVGPSRPEVQEHIRVRASWWGSQGDEGWDHLYSGEVRWKPPVVVWVAGGIHERVNLWRTLHWLRHLGVRRQEVFPVEVDLALRTDGSGDPAREIDESLSVADHPDEVLLERLTGAQPMPDARYDSAVNLWAAYVAPDPVPFVRSCLNGVEGFPELGRLWAFLSHFFPRRARDGSLHLSRFDHLLFTLLSAEWQTPVSLFVHDSDPGDEIRRLLSCTGDLFLPRRLGQWAGHLAGAALEQATGPKPEQFRSPPRRSFVVTRDVKPDAHAA